MDDRLYLDVNRLARDTPWAHTVLGAYALWGGLVLLAFLLVGGWLWARTRPDAPGRCAVALLTGVATVVALLANQQVLSPLFARPRPYLAHPDALVILARSADYSFPSDHAVLAGAFAAGLLVLNRALGLVASVAAVFLAFARVYAGMHYPGDTLAGLLAGAVVAIAVILLLRRPVTALLDHLAAGPLRPLVTSGPGAHRAARDPAHAVTGTRRR